MKKLIVLALAACALAPAFAQTSVGVSIGVNQPGIYGRINIGDFPQPRFINAQPVLISRPVHYVQQQPAYLYVPPGHQRNWGHYCGRYNACGQPVYFVREDWVRERYEYRRQHDRYDNHERWDHGRGHGNGNGNGHGRDHDRGRGDDRHDRDHRGGRD